MYAVARLQWPVWKSRIPLLPSTISHSSTLLVVLSHFMLRFSWSLSVTLTTFGRTPLHEGSARCRNLYLTTLTTLTTENHPCRCGIRTRNPSNLSAVDPRLRPLGHWDRHFFPKSYFFYCAIFYNAKSHRKATEFFCLLGYYAAWGGLKPTFLD